MKKVSSILVIFFSLTHFAVAQSAIINTQGISAKESFTQDAISLPFLEDWSSGSFETNNWTTSCTNWKINIDQGNEKPCTEFSSNPVMVNYSCLLTSDEFITESIFVGEIFLEFDVKLIDFEETGKEKLYVEIYDGNTWLRIKEFNNNGDTEWLENTINITEIAIGNNFKVRFNATGQDTYKMASWFIDNISVYNNCDAPYDLDGWAITYEYDEWWAEILWKAPESSIIIDSVWKYWHDDQCSYVFGIPDTGIDYSVAIRWDVGQLAEYNGDTIGSIKFEGGNDFLSTIVLKVWKEENAAELVYEDTVTGDLLVNEWNEIALNTPVIIDGYDEYWVGFTVDGFEVEYYPFMLDGGPAKVGYGSMFYTDAVGWRPFSESYPFFDYNFKIQMKLINNDTIPTNCLGFDLFREDENSSGFEWYDYIPFEQGEERYEYIDVFVPSGSDWEYCYRVNATWGFNGDTCISEYAINVIPIYKYVCVRPWIGIDETGHSDLNIYPNPVINNLIVKATLNIDEIKIFNMEGQLLFNKEFNGLDKADIAVSFLPPGIYLLQIQTRKGVVTEKFLKF